MARKMKDLIDEVSALARASFSACGYRKRAGDIYTCELGEQVLGWVGLNRDAMRADGLLEICPVIGVRNQDVQRLKAELTGKKYPDHSPPTVFVHLGYLMPENCYQPWFFEHGGDNAAMVDRMVDAVEAYGKPFMRSNATLTELVETLKDWRYVDPSQVKYLMPLALSLLGRTDEAKRYLAAQLKKIGDAIDEGSKGYREFSVRFLHHLSADPV